MHQLGSIRKRARFLITKYPGIFSACLFIFGAIILTELLFIGHLSTGDFVIGFFTYFLGCTTIYLALTEMAESRENRRHNRDLAARERAISNYPLLSQKIRTEGGQGNALLGRGDTQEYETHFRILIKNYGKGPAINQDRVDYRFFKGGIKKLQCYILITGAHDIISPRDERPLNMTKLSRGQGRNDWNLDMEKQYDTIWIRLPHEDIQRNECCNCTKYEYQPKLIGRFGKTERYWYFASYPEISSEKCKECEWRTLEDAAT